MIYVTDKTVESLSLSLSFSLSLCQSYINGTTSSPIYGPRSFLHVFDAAILVQARDLDEKLRRNEEVGPLAGVLVAVKDNICTTEMPFMAGSRVLERYTPPYDATAVRKMKELGGIVVGKTNLDEFGMVSTTEGSAFQIRVDFDVLARAHILKFLSKEGEERDVTGYKEMHIKNETLRNKEFCPDFQSNLITAQSDLENMPYINRKLEGSSFQNFSWIVDSCFVEEVMTVGRREGHSAEN
ncbi:hypothetical protein ACLB2K_032070 [Fragaria x ananassa]